MCARICTASKQQQFHPWPEFCNASFLVNTHTHTNCCLLVCRADRVCVDVLWENTCMESGTYDAIRLACSTHHARFGMTENDDGDRMDAVFPSLSLL